MLILIHTHTSVNICKQKEGLTSAVLVIENMNEEAENAELHLFKEIVSLRLLFPHIPCLFRYIPRLNVGVVITMHMGTCEQELPFLWYSRLLISSEDRFAPICACKNNRWIWRHNAGTPCSHDATNQTWWSHNVKSEKTVLGNNGEMSDWWLFSVESCVHDIK